MPEGACGYVCFMEKPPRDTDDDLIARLREDQKKIRSGQPVEEEAPVDLADPPVDLDVDGVDDT